MGSAIAFRLFLFFVPLLLLVVGIAGFASGFVTAGTVSKTAGLYGSLGGGDQRGFSPAWVHTVVCGAVRPVRGGDGRPVIEQGLAGSQRSRVAAAVVGTPGLVARGRRVARLICGMTLIAILVNRVREDLGLGLAGLAFVPALVIYGLAWLGVSMMLPRATQDPGALLPGSLLVAVTITVMHAVSELYLPDRLSRASQLYGAIGATVVTLGWFFILGRGIVLAMELNAAIYERYGSISQVVFSLPFFRVLARKSARVRRFFGLQ